jgi:hypothetical protein
VNCSYEGQSANRLQMGIKRKTCDFRNFKNRLFLDISSTNIDTFVPSRYQCVENRSIEVFRLLSQQLASVAISKGRSGRAPSATFKSRWEFRDPVVNRFTRQTLPTVNRKYFFMNILCIQSFSQQKHTIGRCPSVVHSSSTVAILTTETILWTWAWASAT